MKKILLGLIYVFLFIISYYIGKNFSGKQKPKSVNSNRERLAKTPTKTKVTTTTLIINKRVETRTPKTFSDKFDSFVEFWGFPAPEQTPENMKRYQDYLDEFNRDPNLSLKKFNKLINEIDPSLDDKRTLILNLVSKLDISKSEKSQFFASYIQKNQAKLKGEVLHDNYMSLLIAADFFAQSSSEEDIRIFIETELQEKKPIERKNLLDRFRIYYPEIGK